MGNTYLIKTTEPNKGEIFIATKFLSERKDMSPYYGPLPWKEKPEETPQPEIKRAIPFDQVREFADKALAEAEALIKEIAPAEQAETEELGEEETDPNKMTALIAAIDTLNPEEDFTKGGLPKTEVLETLIGLPVSGKERNEAWEEVLKRKAE